jgi:hypothetical protein
MQDGVFQIDLLPKRAIRGCQLASLRILDFEFSIPSAQRELATARPCISEFPPTLVGEKLEK